MSEVEWWVLSPMHKMGRRFLLTASGLAGFAILTIYALYVMTKDGHTPMGLKPPAYWGVHLTSFVYFLGIGCGAALASAYLRLRGVLWAAPVVRLADIVAVLAFVVSGVNIVLEVGSLQVLLDTILYGQTSSPYLWDGLVLILFVIATVGYMYMPMVPDLNRASLRMKNIKGFYRFFSFGYVGNPFQKAVVKRMVNRSALVVLLVLVLVSTVFAWGFADSMEQPVWNAAITGPYFLVTALVTGMALTVVLLGILRRVGHLEPFIPHEAFARFGRFLGVCIMVFLALFVAETLGAEYTSGGQTVEMAGPLWEGEYAPITWAFVLLGLVIPAVILLLPSFGTARWVFLASAMTSAAMWARSYFVVLPGMTHHLAPYRDGIYHPSLAEATLMAGSFVYFALLLVAFTRFFPLVSIWEVEDLESAQAKGPAGRAAGKGAAKGAKREAAKEVAP